MKINKKIKSLFTIFYFLIVPTLPIFSDSISKLEKKIPELTGKNKVEALNQLAREYWPISDEKALDVAQEALKFALSNGYLKQEVIARANIAFSKARLNKFEEAVKSSKLSLKLAEKINDIECMIFALKINGEIHDRLRKHEKSLNVYLKLLKLQEKSGVRSDIAKTLFLIGSCYQDLGNYKNALENYEKSLSIYKELGNKEEIANSIRYIASIYENRGEYGTATQYYFKSLKILEEIGNSSLIAKTFRKLGGVYFLWKDYKESLKYLKKSLELYHKIKDKGCMILVCQDIGMLYLYLKDYSKGEFYYKKSIDLIKTNKNSSKLEISSVYENIGYYLFKKKMNEEALKYYKMALQIHEKIEDITYRASNYRELARIYFDSGNYQEALKYFKKSIKDFEETNRVNILIDLYQRIANLYYKIKDYQNAYKYKDLYASLREKIFNQESAKKMAEMQTKYETEKKEKEIEALKKDNRIQQLTLVRQRIIRNAVIIVAVLVLIILVMFFKKYRYLLTFWKKKNHIGHYRLTGKIASGGMGIIYKAHDMLDKSRELAIKVLREEYFEDETQKKRFKNEAAIIDQFDHPHIVKVIERGEADGSLYIAMELLEGQTLFEILKEEGKFSIPIALDIMAQAADAVFKIHQKDIIHRDLKPENIMIVKTEENPYFVKLLDFGLSKTQSFTRLTKTGMILGTIFYLSPEQVLDTGITLKSDVYSLGIIYYEMLSGQKPFAGESEESVIKQILEKEPVELQHVRPDVPKELNKLIMKMTGKKPQQRPAIKNVLDTLKKLTKPG